jgi:hypothetical protein
MMTALIVLTAMITAINFLALCVAGWIVYCMAFGRPIL